MGPLLSRSHLHGKTIVYSVRFTLIDLKVVNSENSSVSPATGNLAPFMQILRYKNHCLGLSTNMHGGLVTWLQGLLKIS